MRLVWKNLHQMASLAVVSNIYLAVVSNICFRSTIIGYVSCMDEVLMGSLYPGYFFPFVDASSIRGWARWLLGCLLPFPHLWSPTWYVMLPVGCFAVTRRIHLLSFLRGACWLVDYMWKNSLSFGKKIPIKIILCYIPWETIACLWFNNVFISEDNTCSGVHLITKSTIKERFSES